MRKPKIVSIYSGCGGIDLGFHKAGFETIFATDIWDIACKSLEKNFGKTGAEIQCDDIVNIDFRSIKDEHGEINGLVGGPPCPPFSKSRFYRKEKERGIDDIDGFITLSNYFRAVEELEPEFFFQCSECDYVFEVRSYMKCKLIRPKILNENTI